MGTTNEVSIEVFDEDFGKDDTLGSTVLDLTQVQEKKQLLNQWIPLKNCKSGEVLISAEFISQATVQKQKESEPLESIAKQDENQKSSEIPKQKELDPGLITVTVHKARDIEKKGMFGKADPY